MSKQRQTARAQRAAEAAQRAGAARAEARRAAAERARREQRRQRWAGVRLWQHGSGFRRNRERWGALATLVLVVLVAVFVVTRDWTEVLGTALIVVVALPVLVLLFLGKDHR